MTQKPAFVVYSGASDLGKAFHGEVALSVVEAAADKEESWPPGDAGFTF